MTRYEAFVESSWREHGLANVVVARIKDANVEIGCFLVDWWCLGVKDAAFFDDATEAGLTEMLDEQMPGSRRERMHPACAKKLIEGSLAYAEKLGFAPHRDFRKARRVLSGLDATDCPETFEYGHDGRPCYVEGPHDSPERVDKVLALLEARLGPDGYDFEEYDDGTNEELDAGHAGDVLYDFIEKFPAPAFGTFTELSGLTASLQVCPKLILLNRALALFLHPGHPEWTTKEEAQEVAESFAVYWSHAGGLLASADANEEESYVVDLHEDDETEPLPRIFSLWCRGFMRSFELWPEAWADALERPELQAHFDVLRAWAGAAETPAGKPYPKDDDAEDRITTAVVALYRTFKPERESEARNGPPV